jgi:hypothetical protein
MMVVERQYFESLLEDACRPCRLVPPVVLPSAVSSAHSWGCRGPVGQEAATLVATLHNDSSSTVPSCP